MRVLYVLLTLLGIAVAKTQQVDAMLVLPLATPLL